MLDIILSGEEDWPANTDWQALCERAANAAVTHSDWRELATGSRTAEISVRLADDEEVRALNQAYRDKDKATNVLSFPMAEPTDFGGATDGPELMLGDIILARSTCEREAADKSVPMESHATHLVLHGTLHLLGYDHMIDAEADAMEAIEVRALAHLGIDDPYHAVTGDETHHG
jgi:probable rRNA maturation factor